MLLILLLKLEFLKDDKLQIKLLMYSNLIEGLGAWGKLLVDVG